MTYTHELKTIRLALDQASQILPQLRNEGLKIHIKSDGSPVTNADLAVNKIIQETLLSTFPDDGWLSEESPDNPARLKSQRVWVLDPIDGTKPFIRGLPYYTISLALIDQGQPVIGVIYNPATQEYFCAVREQPALLNHRPIHVRRQTVPSRQTFIVNGWQIKQTTLEGWKQEHHCPPLLGSIAYCLALVAAGYIDGLIYLGPQNEWDIAAGCLLVQAAGGLVFDKNQQPITWNQPTPLVDGIIVIRPDALPTIQRWLAELKP